MNRLEYWKNFIKAADVNTLAKDLHPAWDEKIQKYTSFTSIEADALSILEKEMGCKNMTAVDFGCGLGRNLGYLSSTFKDAIGYDLQEMIEKGKVLNLPYNMTSNWSYIEQVKPDIAYDCVVFQHLDINILIESLIRISKTCKYLYSCTRSYNDTNKDFRTGKGGVNLFCLIYSLNVFKPIYCSIDYNLAATKSDETHYSVLYRITN